jgi:hypothetical protein
MIEGLGWKHHRAEEIFTMELRYGWKRTLSSLSGSENRDSYV